MLDDEGFSRKQKRHSGTKSSKVFIGLKIRFCENHTFHSQKNNTTEFKTPIIILKFVKKILSFDGFEI